MWSGTKLLFAFAGEGFSDFGCSLALLTEVLAAWWAPGSSAPPHLSLEHVSGAIDAPVARVSPKGPKGESNLYGVF